MDEVVEAGETLLIEVPLAEAAIGTDDPQDIALYHDGGDEKELSGHDVLHFFGDERSGPGDVPVRPTGLPSQTVSC